MKNPKLAKECLFGWLKERKVATGINKVNFQSRDKDDDAEEHLSRLLEKRPK